MEKFQWPAQSMRVDGRRVGTVQWRKAQETNSRSAFAHKGKQAVRSEEGQQKVWLSREKPVRQ